jgi:hypothetical protein
METQASHSGLESQNIRGNQLRYSGSAINHRKKVPLVGLIKR